MDANYTGVGSIFNIIADDFKKRRGLIGYLSGLICRLYGAHVSAVKSGFVSIKMTEGIN